jgi:hypothetical protein
MNNNVDSMKILDKTKKKKKTQKTPKNKTKTQKNYTWKLLAIVIYMIRYYIHSYSKNQMF